MADVVKAIEVTEGEIDHEVSRVVSSAARPGRMDKVGEKSGGKCLNFFIMIHF